MSIRWVWFIAARNIFKRQKKSPSPVLSILGIATGVFALIVIIAVMNGFQLGFIESIVEISSYHLRAGPVADDKTDEAARALLSVPGVTAAVPFREFQGIARGRRGGQQAVLVRGVPANAPVMDTAMARRLEFEEGTFDLDDGRNALLGAELARRLGVKTGDEITLFSIPSIFSPESSGEAVLKITGIFRTGFYEYDTGWVFMDITAAAPFSETGPVMGIKLKNRFADRQILEPAQASLRSRPGFETAEFSLWRDYNRSFFGALRTEKLFMFILVGLIFIVVGLNIYQSQRRTILEHREDIGLLRAVGGRDTAVRLIFVLDGAIIGFSGAAAGLVPGLLIASNITVFFTIMESVVNFFIHIVNAAAGIFRSGGVGDFAFFSPAVFYIKEIPSRIIPAEVVMIFLFGFFSALLAAWFASRRVSRIPAAEVLRYE